MGTQKTTEGKWMEQEPWRHLTTSILRSQIHSGMPSTVGADPFGTKLHSLLLSIFIFLGPKTNSSLAPRMSLPQGGLSRPLWLVQPLPLSFCVLQCALYSVLRYLELRVCHQFLLWTVRLWRQGLVVACKLQFSFMAGIWWFMFNRYTLVIFRWRPENLFKIAITSLVCEVYL